MMIIHNYYVICTYSIAINDYTQQEAKYMLKYNFANQIYIVHNLKLN